MSGTLRGKNGTRVTREAQTLRTNVVAGREGRVASWETCLIAPACSRVTPAEICGGDKSGTTAESL